MQIQLSEEELEDIHLQTRKMALQFSSTHRVGGVQFGERRSVYADQGLEFREMRDYEPGDDVTQIDFTASEAEGKLLVVKRTEPREMRSLIIFDLSKSMFLHKKAETAYAAASMIIFSAINQEIPTGLWGRAGGFEVSKRPRGGRAQRRQVINLLKDALMDPRQVPKRILTLEQWRRSLPEGSFVFIISDFLGENSFFMKLLENKYSKYRIVPIVVQSELEYTFPDIGVGRITLPIMEVGSGNIQYKTLTRKDCARIRAENEKRFAKLKEIFKSNKNLRWAHIPNFDLEEIRQEIQKTIR